MKSSWFVLFGCTAAVALFSSLQFRAFFQMGKWTNHHHNGEDHPETIIMMAEIGRMETAFRIQSMLDPREPPQEHQRQHSHSYHRPVATNSTRNGSVLLPTIDILSVGSQRLPQLQQAQQATFGSHKAVRYFYAATEEDDSEVGCHRHLTKKEAVLVSLHCRQKSSHSQFPVLQQLAKRFIMSGKLKARQDSAVGWLCAQKRPADGFFNMIRKYQYRSSSSSDSGSNTDHTATTSTNLPDYLLVVDDDSFVNLDNVVQFLPSVYPVQTRRPQIIAGCLIIMDDIMEFTMPHGGLGILFNRLALERFLQPLYCKNHTTTGDQFSNQPTGLDRDDDDDGRIFDDHEFERLACERLAQNGIGEQSVFQDGMNIASLMHAYITRQPYYKIRRWDDIGNCLHSDTAWAYFANYYYLSANHRQPHFPNNNVLPRRELQKQEKQQQHRGRGRSTSSTRSRRVRRNKSSNTTNRHRGGPSELLPPLRAPDRLIGYKQSQRWLWRKKGTPKNPHLYRECRHGNNLPPYPANGDENCGVHAHFCHRITATHMYQLHQQNVLRYPQNYPSSSGVIPTT